MCLHIWCLLKENNVFFFRLLLDTLASNAFEIWTIFTHTVYFSSSFFQGVKYLFSPLAPRAFYSKNATFFHIECVCNHVYSILYIIICRMLWLWIEKKGWEKGEEVEKYLKDFHAYTREKSIFPREFMFNWLYIYTTIM